MAFDTSILVRRYVFAPQNPELRLGISYPVVLADFQGETNARQSQLERPAWLRASLDC
jgi:hypothetical protein